MFFSKPSPSSTRSSCSKWDRNNHGKFKNGVAIKVAQYKTSEAASVSFTSDAGSISGHEEWEPFVSLKEHIEGGIRLWADADDISFGDGAVGRVILPFHGLVGFAGILISVGALEGAVGAAALEVPLGGVL